MAIINIPGTYLHTNMDEHTIMLLKVRLEELTYMNDPNLFSKFVRSIASGRACLI